MGLVAGMNENIFITENMLKALGLPALLLILHSAIALLGIKFSTDLPYDENCDDVPDNVSEDTPILHDQPEYQISFTLMKKVSSAFLLTSSLLLALYLPYPLLLHVFNSCPTLHSSQHSNISCSSVSPTVAHYSGPPPPPPPPWSPAAGV